MGEKPSPLGEYFSFDAFSGVSTAASGAGFITIRNKVSQTSMET
jgi:hypothetical protein